MTSSLIKSWRDAPRRVLRDEFVTLKRRLGGRSLCYLDTATTALKPRSVIAGMTNFYQNISASGHGGLHTLSAEATGIYEECRSRVADWLDAPSSECVVLTRGATSSLNLVARGLEQRLKAGDEILLTEMEHHANLVPWIELKKRRGVGLKHIPFTAEGELDMSKLKNLISSRTKVISLVHVSNVLGTINRLAPIVEEARRVGAVVVLDAAQSVGHLPISFAQLGVDFLAFSAHKCCGPMGLGFLLGTPEALELLEPLEFGGQMIEEVYLDDVVLKKTPFQFETGTADVGAAAGFLPAIEMFKTLGESSVRDAERQLAGYTIEKLQELGQIRILGPLDPGRRGGLVSFVDEEIHPHDLATILDELAVAVRAGHHCAQPLHRKLGIPASTRASFGLYTTAEDVDRLVDGISYARRILL